MLDAKILNNFLTSTNVHILLMIKTMQPAKYYEYPN